MVKSSPGFGSIGKVIATMTLHMIYKGAIRGLCLSILQVLVIPAFAQSLPDFVMDDGKILNPAEARQINQLLTGLYTDKGYDFRLISIDNLAGGSLRETSLIKAREIGIKGQGYKIAGMIFISSQEKKLSLEFSPAVEWIIPDSEGAYIKREMTNAFRSGNFAQGIIDGFLRMNFLADESKWAVDFDTYDQLRDNISTGIGKIVSLTAVTVTKQFSSEKLTEEQFAKNYFIYVRAPDNTLVKLNFSKYSLGQIQELIARGEGVVFGRVIETNPLDLNFLGWVGLNEDSQ